MITLFNRSTNEKIAYLDDVIIEDSIQITRKINGEFTLSFELLEDDLKRIYLESEGYILCDGYYFDIKYIEKEHSDTLTYRIECEHVSYRLIENEIEYYTFDGTPSQILTDILSGTEFSAGVIDSTEVITFAVYEETNKLGLIQKLSNLLNLEIDYNSFSISLKNTIGENKGFATIFGKNLKGIKKIIDRRNNLTYYDIDLVELKNHPDYVDFKDLEKVGVGDTIRIIDKAMNIDIQNKVVKRSYNPIKSINSKLEIANSIELLTDKVTKIQRDTLNKGKTYHGIRISPDTGFES
ncbi:MAG: phage tail spike protein, partial [Bacillota bacterium]|nr:phage tail spike protein [Bacillota bacterium]